MPINLDIEREKRAAARREVGKIEEPIVIGGTVVATLPSEMPLAALEPLRSLDRPIALLLSEAVNLIAVGGVDDSTITARLADLFASLLVEDGDLPTRILDVIITSGKVLIGEAGVTALLGAGLSVQDAIALGKGILGNYGLSLGEASRSSESQTGGATANEISSASTDSTSETPTETPAIPAS